MTFEMPDLDVEIVIELFDTIYDSLDDVEILLENLSTYPNDQDRLNDLFRHLHSIKGNFRVCFMEPLSQYMHGVEETLSEVRNGRLEFNPITKEIMLMAVDKLRTYMAQLHDEHCIETDEINLITHGFLELACTEVDQFASRANAFLREITGSAIAEGLVDVEIPSGSTENNTEISVGGLDDDLVYFETLAKMLDTRLPNHNNRSEQLLRIVRATETYLPYKLDMQQVTAAVYIHDIGMAFVPDSIISASGKLTDEQRATLHKHPHVGYQLLRRLEHWDEAANMVLQHHERIDGKGYPHGVTGDQICNGAKLLAVGDAFCSLTNEREDRSTRRSVLRALMEISSHCDSQFDRETVEAFTKMAADVFKRAQ